MKPTLKPGLAQTRKITVDDSRVISFMGEDCRVYATPRIISDVEYTCRDFLLGHLDRIAIIFAVGVQPKISYRFRGQSFFISCRKDRFFETREHILPEHRGENIFDLAGEKCDPYLGIGLARKQMIEDQHFSKD